MVHLVIRRLLPIIGAGFLLGACAHANSVVLGGLYSDVKGPLAVSPQTGSSKMGTASCSSILGIIATGDCSINAAAKAGGITKIHNVDFESMNILTFYATFTTIV